MCRCCSIEGPELWQKMSRSFGYLTMAGYGGHIFPVIIGETGSFMTSVSTYHKPLCHHFLDFPSEICAPLRYLTHSSKASKSVTFALKAAAWDEAQVFGILHGYEIKKGIL